MAGDADGGKILSFADIGAANDTEYETIAVPEWGGNIRVGTLDAEAWIAYVEENEEPKARRMAPIRLIIRSLVDEDGNHIGTPRDIEVLKKRNQKVIQRLALQIIHLNGWDIKAAPEKAGNGSSEAPSGASPTA